MQDKELYQTILGLDRMVQKVGRRVDQQFCGKNCSVNAIFQEQKQRCQNKNKGVRSHCYRFRADFAPWGVRVDALLI